MDILNMPKITVSNDLINRATSKSPIQALNTTNNTNAKEITFKGANPLENIENYPEEYRKSGYAQLMALNAYNQRLTDERNIARENNAIENQFKKLQEIGINPYQAYFNNNAITSNYDNNYTATTAREITNAELQALKLENALKQTELSNNILDLSEREIKNKTGYTIISEIMELIKGIM